ncbi:MAG: hypothetical protein U1A27_08085 [Phycisphaerae bacterium]
MMSAPLLADAELVPPLDEFGLPGPVWLFRALLLVTFAAHVVFMNFALGAGVLIPAIWRLGRRGDRPEAIELALCLTGAWPIAVSFTITSGVAVLLFTQVLYGHVFYTANILMGWRWLALVAYLVVGFYAVYGLKRALHRQHVAVGMALCVLALACFLSAAHAFNNNAILSLRPGLWRDIATGQRHPYASDPMWVPRYLHTIIGSLAVSGLWMVALGRGSRSLGDAARRLAGSAGLRVTLWATVAQVLSGAWLLAALDGATRASLFSFTEPRGIAWFLAAAAGIVTIGVLLRAVERPQEPRSFWLPAGLIAAVLLGMSAGREQIRVETLSKLGRALYEPTDVRMQTGPLVAFLAVLIAGAVVIVVMLRWLRSAPARSPAGGSTLPDGPPHDETR